MTVSMKSRILVVDDFPIIVEGYRALINRQQDMEICGVAATPLEAIRKAILTKPHLAVVDFMLKNGNVLDLVKDLNIRLSEMKVLVFSARDEFVFAERALHAGASGYLNKAETTGNLIDAIRGVLQGKICLSPAMTDRLLHRASLGDEIQKSSVSRLADRELEAFELMGLGLTTRDIATQMHISPKTVDRYRENIKEKLDLPNSTEVIRRATLWVEEGY